MCERDCVCERERKHERCVRSRLEQAKVILMETLSTMAVAEVEEFGHTLLMLAVLAAVAVVEQTLHLLAHRVAVVVVT